MTKIENHLKKIESLESSLKKLDSYEDDYIAIIELYVLICAHYINAALHRVGKLHESRDIKHNLIASFLAGQFDEAEEARSAMQKLENLRPSHIYGKGEDGKMAREAERQYAVIKKICKNIIGEIHEKQF